MTQIILNRISNYLPAVEFAKKKLQVTIHYLSKEKPQLRITYST